MKKICLILLFLPTISLTQKGTINKKMDSLLVLLNTKKEDTSKVNLYRVICEEYSNHQTDTDKLVFYNNKLLKLSEKLKYQRGIGYYYFNKSMSLENGEEAIENFKKARDIFFNTKDTLYSLITGYYLANANFGLGRHKESKKNIYETLKLGVGSIYFNDTADLFTFLGFMNHQDGFLNIALKDYENALSYYNKAKNNLSNKAVLFLYFAYTYSDLGNYKEAIRYLDYALKIEKSYTTLTEKAATLNKMNSSEAALKILMDTQKIKTETGVNDIFNNRCVLSETYFNLKKYQLAIANLDTISTGNISQNLKLSRNNLLAKSYLKLKNYQKAREYNDKAMARADSTKFFDVKQDAYLCKSEIEESTGNYKAALSYFKKLSDLREASNTKLKNDRISELQIGFDIAEKENNILNLELEKREKTIENESQKKYIFYMFLALGFVTVSIFFFIKNNLIIKNKNKIIEINNIRLQNAQNLTQQSLSEKEVLLKEIHHRVKNNMQLVISLLKIQSRDVNQLSIKDFVKISQSRINSMALIHENLYQSDDLNKVNFKEYLHNLTQSILNSYEGFKEVELNIDVNELYLNIEMAIPVGLIINELINNSYKHAFVEKQKGIINLKLVQNAEQYELIIADNGIGMDENKNNIKSLGIELVRLLVSQLKGVMKVHSTLGTSYTIQFQNISM
jgi:two-component system, sensor histidine kinase PdtaS